MTDLTNPDVLSDPSKTISLPPVDPNGIDFSLNPATPDAPTVLWKSQPAKSFYWPESETEVDHWDQLPRVPTIESGSARPDEPRAWAANNASHGSANSGRYHVGREIGRGGVGVVHEAWDVQLERETAVKVLLESHRTKPEIVRRFLVEAQITSRLQHPGIVAIHDLGWSPDRRPFFVMRLVRGQTLEEILRSRESPGEDLPRLLNIFLQVCQAVAYAHSQCIIHRDLKPANIMVGSFGVVKVMDWGLAKMLGEPDLPDAMAAARLAAELSNRSSSLDSPEVDSAPNETMLGTIFGTPAYLPPEQARGEIGRIDQRADVFGLGSILCEILTGEPPYTGTDGREVYAKAVIADTTDIRARLCACCAPLDLLSLTEWCLSPDQFDRPADAGNVVEVLTAHLHSDQRRAERDLIRFFDLSLDLFCIASTDEFFLRVNKNFTRVLGYPAEDLTSRPFQDFVHPDDREKTGVEVMRLANGVPCIQFFNRYRHADGHYLWFEWSAQTVPEERAIYAVARDVTKRADPASILR